MSNIIRADIYSIVRGKALYVTFALIMIFHIITIGTQSAGGITIGGAGNLGMEIPEVGFDGIRSASFLYSQMDTMAFFLLPLIILAAAPIFSNQTVKNDIAWGISRTKLYMSKLAIAIGLCVLMVLFHMGVGMAFATLLHGWGGITPDGFWLGLLQTVGAQLVMLIALTCIGAFLIFTFRRTAIVNGAYIAFYLIPSMLLSFFHSQGFNVTRLLDFDIMSGINRLGFLSQLETYSILTILGVGAAYIVVTTVAGIILFKRAEIK
ncbi:MAG: hypothetical protein FWC13_09160 [Oscillospiraceae bacterium]|nr:hypothetical protein [Oscillospiraceae bacterium]